MNLRTVVPSWRFLALLGFAGVSVYVSLDGPLNPLDLRFHRGHPVDLFNPFAEQLVRAEAEVEALRAELREAAIVDELIPIAAASATSDGTFAVGFPEVQGAEIRHELIAEMRQHPRLQRITTQPAIVGLFAKASDQNSLQSRIGEFRGRAYCLTVHEFPADRPESLHFPWRWGFHDGSRPIGLGACTWFHRYGTPGEHILAWYVSTERGISNPLEASDAEVLEEWQGYDVYDPRWVMIARLMIPYSRTQAGIRACRAGRLEYCRKAPVRDADTRALGIGLNEENRMLFGLQGDLLTNLESEFGEAAMLEFWTSDRTFDEAFSDAFGTSSEAWLHKEVIAEHGPLRAGPLPDSTGWLIPILFGVGAWLIGVLTTLRRGVSS